MKGEMKVKLEKNDKHKYIHFNSLQCNSVQTQTQYILLTRRWIDGHHHLVIDTT